MASLSLNTAAFTAGCKSAISNAKIMSNNVSQSLTTISNQSKVASKDINNMDVALKNIGKGFVATAITAGIYSIGKASILAAVQMQALEVQFKAVFGSARAGTREWEGIVDLSSKWGLDLRQTADDYAKFMAAANLSSIAGEKAKQAFEGISVGITGLHLSSEKAGRIFLQLQQMMSKGKVQAEELRVIAESLPGTYGLMAEAMGITGAELAIRMRKGTVDAAELVEKLGKVMVKTYGTAATEAATKGQAAINNFNSAMFQSKAALGETLMPAFQGFIDWFKGDGVGIIKIWISWVMKAGAGLAALVDKPLEIFKKRKIELEVMTTKGMYNGFTFTPEGEELYKKKLKEAGLGALAETFEEIDTKLGLIKPEGLSKTAKEIADEKVANDRRAKADKDARAAMSRDSVNKQMDPKSLQFESELRKWKTSSEKKLDASEGNAYLTMLAGLTKQAADFREKLTEPMLISFNVAGAGSGQVKTSLGAHNRSLFNQLNVAEKENKTIETKALINKLSEGRKEYLKELDDSLVAIAKGDSDDSSLKNRLDLVDASVDKKNKEQIEAFDAMLKYGVFSESDFAGALEKFTADLAAEKEKAKKVIVETFLNQLKTQVANDQLNLDLEMKATINSASLNDLELAIQNAGLAVDREYQKNIDALAKIGIYGNEATAAIEKLKKTAQYMPIVTSISNMQASQLKEEQSLRLQSDATKRKTDFMSNLSPYFGGRNTDKIQENDMYEAQRAKIAPQIDDLNKRKNGLTDSAEIAKINKQLEDLDAKAKSLAGTEFKLFKDGEMEKTIAQLKMATDGVGILRDATTQMAGPLADAFARFADNGRLGASELAKSLMKTLQVYAAQKTAMLLMESMYLGIMGLVYSFTNQPLKAAEHYAAAGVALQGAGMMGAIVLGSGLAGMAHDGIDNIPEDGTWLLKQNERVVDDRTNADLKTFLKEGGSSTKTINMPITINGGDEQGIMKALPILKQQMLAAINEDIAMGGQTRDTIKTYAV